MSFEPTPHGVETAPIPDVSAYLDGYVIWFGGRVVKRFGTLSAAARARPVACEALELLAKTLGRRAA